MRNLLQSKGGKQMNLHQQLLRADIQSYQKRKERAQKRIKTAQGTVDSLNIKIRAKKALL